MHKYKYCPTNITHLNENKVFVFETNVSGFHGAGAAGMAFKGSTKNEWRINPIFQKAINTPKGSKNLIGNWAIFGQAEGFMQGNTGKSYGIITIIRSGLLRSMPLHRIKQQLYIMNNFAEAHKELTFLVTKIGSALTGYTVTEIKSCFDLITFHDNVILPIEYTR